MNNIPIFIVNLKKDTEKKAHMQQLCKQHGLDCQFIDAVYGKEVVEKKLAKVYNRKRTLEEMGRELTAGEIGCTLSHKYIYQKMIDEHIEKAIIFEDDIIFDQSIHEVLSSIDNFPDDWEVTLLIYYRILPSLNRYCISLRNRIPVSKHFKIVRFIDLMHSTAGYAINLSGATKLLSSLDEGMYKPIDHYTGDEQHINLYGLHPKPVNIDPLQGLNSSIAEERNKTRSDSEYPDTDNLRTILKKIGLHHLFKKINTKRLDILYYLQNFKKCIIQPKKYT
jgi:glycosyl transferase family 25